MEIENFNPISDRVLIELVYNEKTKGGIYLPDTSKEKGTFAKVLRVGPGKVSPVSGDLMPMDVKPGDNILIGKYTGWKFDNENKNLRMIHNSDILAIT